MRKLMLFFMFMFFSVAVFANTPAPIEEMGNVIEEISLLNLLRGIYLSEEQARGIAVLAVEAEKIRNAGLDEINKLGTLQPLSQLRDELYTALAESPPAIRAKVVELDNRAHEITGEVLHQLAAMEDRVKGILTHGQQNIFWEFVPCIVPELDLENPVRTGQAAASSRLMPAVELIRSTSEDIWKKHGQAYLDHILKVIEQDAGKMTAETREDLRRRLVKHAWKIRSMKEADFLIHRDSLAEDILLVNREHTLRSGFRTTGKIARFFLSPAAARVLPKWVETHFAAGTATEKPTVVDDKAKPVEAVPADADQSKLTGDEADRHFWEKQVPTSLARLSETPYYDHIYHAFGKPFAIRLFDEESKYVDLHTLLKEAGVIITREKELTFYNLTQGEP